MYKNNLQKHQLTTIFSGIMYLGNSLGHINQSDVTKESVIPTLKALDLIPEEMHIEEKDDKIKDTWGNTIEINHVEESSGAKYYSITLHQKASTEAYFACLNTINVMKYYSENIWHIAITSNNWLKIYGDKYCYNGSKCLKNMPITDTDINNAVKMKVKFVDL